MSEEKRTALVDETYDTSKSYNQLLYGRYLFIAKVIGGLAVLVFGLYFGLTRLGKSMKVETRFVPVEEFLSLAEKERAQFRTKIQLMLIEDILKYRQDTVLIATPGPEYLVRSDKGPYDYPEARAIYGCRLQALELMLKRTLFEMRYPFVYTLLYTADELSKQDLSGYTPKPCGPFTLYIAKRLKPVYQVKPADSAQAAITPLLTIALHDSMADYFSSLYAKSSAQALFTKYVGEGPCGPWRDLSVSAFAKLPPDSQAEQRRAFLKLSEAEQKKARKVVVGVSGDYGSGPFDEEPGKHFDVLSERKVHELELTTLLLRYYDMATFSLIYPMSFIYNKDFTALGANANSVMLVALKSGRAPAHYALQQKDCPRILKQGMYADISDYFKDWDQVKYFPSTPLRATTYKGRYYGIPGKVLTADAIEYRRDWLEEPGIIEWFQKKGWIHPVDKRPYIPLTWTYDDFKVIIKLMTDNDPTKKRRGYVDRTGPLMYLDAWGGASQSLGGMYIKPDTSGKRTWLFFRDNPLFMKGLRTVHDMYWKDKSVRSGVDVSYQSAQDDFNGGRAGFSQVVAHGILYASLMQKYTVFGKGRPFGEIVGLTTLPGNPEVPRITNADCNMVGFNPFLTKPQLDIAFEWIKQKYYGEFVNTSLYYEVASARTLGSESVVFRNALASPYALDYAKFDIDFRSVFPVTYVEFYDNLRKTQSTPQGPRFDEFDLLEPQPRQIQDRVFIMFEKVLMDSVPNYEQILNETANYVDNTFLNYRDSAASDKLRRFAEAQLAFTAKYTPERVELTKAVFKRQKVLN